MKTLKELRNIDLKIEERCSSLKYFKESKIDWEVYLPTKDKNLQRAFVWTLEQQRELIWSVLIGRHIPHCALISAIDKNDSNKELFLVIDGKQRLRTLIGFTQNLFTLLIDGNEYLFSQLPYDYQQAIDLFYFRYYVVHEELDKRITDEQKINWFKFLNYAGTPQDAEHLRNLE